MPKITRDLIQSIAILLRPHSITEKIDPVGTAFLIQVRDCITHPINVYLVTCAHCLQSAKLVRLHDQTILSLDASKWKKSPSGDDVAAMDVTDALPAAFSSDELISLGEIVTQQDAAYGIGTEIFMLGLHVNERDTGANTPRARFGNISAWASEATPIVQGNGVPRPTHLGDMRSRTGFSGSPVFAYFELPGLSGSGVPRRGLFGIHSDQFPDRVEIISGNKAFLAEIPSSMTKIVPAWVLQFIETDPDFRTARLRRTSESSRVEVPSDPESHCGLHGVPSSSP